MNDAPATVAVPWFSAVAEYMLDAWQRTVLTWDVLRERGNQALDHARSGKAPGPRLRLRAHPGRADVPEARELHPPAGQAARPINHRWIRRSGRWS